MSFVTKIQREFPDLTLLYLQDGRVVGVDNESIVIYESIEEVWDGETKDRPTLTLYKEA